MTEVGAPAEAESQVVFMRDLALIAGSAVRWRVVLGAEDIVRPVFGLVSLKFGGCDCVGSVSAAVVCNFMEDLFRMGEGRLLASPRASTFAAVSGRRGMDIDTVGWPLSDSSIAFPASSARHLVLERSNLRAFCLCGIVAGDRSYREKTPLILVS